MAEVIQLAKRRRRVGSAPEIAAATSSSSISPRPYTYLVGRAGRAPRSATRLAGRRARAGRCRAGDELRRRPRRRAARASSCACRSSGPSASPPPSRRDARRGLRGEGGCAAAFAIAAGRLAFCGGFDLEDPDILAEAAAAAGLDVKGRSPPRASPRRDAPSLDLAGRAVGRAAARRCRRCAHERRASTAGRQRITAAWLSQPTPSAPPSVA